MAFTFDDLMSGLRFRRRWFLKHLDGLHEDQWNWKPYPECKSIRETLAHLVVDDRAALQSLQTGKEPDYETFSKIVSAQESPTRLLELLSKSHDELCMFLEKQHARASLDAEVCIWGNKMKLASGIPFLSSEDYYHAGQVAFVRMATDPKWDYYSSIYGIE